MLLSTLPYGQIDACENTHCIAGKPCEFWECIGSFCIPKNTTVAYLVAFVLEQFYFGMSRSTAIIIDHMCCPLLHNTATSHKCVKMKVELSTLRLKRKMHMILTNIIIETKKLVSNTRFNF